MISLDTLSLSMTGNEITGDQLAGVDGGLVPLIIALAVFDAALWTYIAVS